MTMNIPPSFSPLTCSPNGDKKNHTSTKKKEELGYVDLYNSFFVIRPIDSGGCSLSVCIFFSLSVCILFDLVSLSVCIFCFCGSVGERTISPDSIHTGLNTVYDITHEKKNNKKAPIDRKSVV